jgi:dihydroorotate dehydrogenase electron transfer subunit
MEKPKILPIKAIRQETENIKTFTFDYELGAHPGQFVMLWIPRIDQIPISVSRQYNNSFDLTVHRIGRSTKLLFDIKKGDKVGISGPYGKGFNISSGSKIILVGGGCGSAPMRFLADEALRNNCEITFITGAKTINDVLFKNEFKETCIATDDGSGGLKGFTTEILESEINNKKIDKVYTCGPEIMMKKIVDICIEKGIECEASLERYMKCGFGICGQCSVDPEGICICKEGPVFSGEELKKISEFGHYHRDKAGLKNNF